MFIKKVLECTILRICELKTNLILANTRKGSVYVHLDQLLFDLKYDPSIIEIPIPKYFKENDRIPDDICNEFKEEVQRGKPKKEKKKKKKKKGGEVEVVKEPISLNEK